METLKRTWIPMVQQRAQEQESQSMSLYLLPLRGVTNKTESFCRVSPTTVSPHPRSHKTSNHPSMWLPADVGHWTPSPLFPTDMPTLLLPLGAPIYRCAVHDRYDTTSHVVAESILPFCYAAVMKINCYLVARSVPGRCSNTGTSRD
jgi:hypothetical protein